MPKAKIQKPDKTLRTPSKVSAAQAKGHVKKAPVAAPAAQRIGNRRR